MAEANEPQNEGMLSFLGKASNENMIEPWSGTFSEFLRLYETHKEEYKNIGALAHQRVYNMIISSGVEEVEYFGKKRKKYNFFEDKLFGIESTIDEIMAYIHAAAQRTETSRRLLLMYGPPSSGKCLSGDSLVYDSITGDQIRLDEIVNGRKASVCAVDSNGKMKMCGISARQSNGIKQTYTITTALGHKINATANHKFLTFEDWQQVSDLKVGNRIAVARNLPEPMQAVDQPDYKVRFAAYMISEGNCRTMVRFTNSEDVIKTEFIEDSLKTAHSIDDTMPLTAKIDDKFSVRISKNRTESRKHHPLIRYMKDLGIWGKLAKDKVLNAQILSLPNSSLALFLGRLYSCDGSVEKNTISYCSASSELINQLSLLLRRFGIVARTRYKIAAYRDKNKNIRKFDAWCLDITDSSSIRSYKELIAPHLIGKKKLDFERFWKLFINKNHTPCGDVFPSSINGLIKSELKSKGMLIHSRNYRDKGNHFLRTDRKTRNVSRVKLQKIADTIQSETLQQVVDSDVYYDKIVKIDLGPKVEVFDIEVPRHHNFVVNGIIAHNSEIVNLIKKGLEDYTRTKEGAVFALDKSAMHENPFLLVPHKHREEFGKRYGIHIEGELSPHSQYRLDNDYKGNFLDFPIKQIYLSEAGRVGIGTWLPSDPKGQDVSELVGSINLAKIAEYGNDSDPRAYNFDGELNVANRGIMEFIEGLKADEKFLRSNLTATQEKSIKAPRFGMVSVDIFIIMHTNESEFIDFMKKEKYEAYHDRMVIVRAPYNTGADNEIKIYEKLLFNSDAIKGIAITPHTLDAAAMFSVLSRLEPPHGDLTISKKMKLYNGENVKGFKLNQVPDIKRKSNREAMTGVSPRFINDQISLAISKCRDEGKNYITAIDILRQLNWGVSQRDSFTEEEKNRYKEFLDIAKAEYNDILRNDIQKAFFLSYDDEARVLFDNYINNVDAYCSHEQIVNPVTMEKVDPDEKLMNSIEDHINISDSGRHDFRVEILNSVASSALKGKEFDYTRHASLKKGIQKQLFEERKGAIRMTVSTRNPDPEALKRLNEVIKRMCDNQGYTPEAANELLAYASAHLFDK